MNYPMGTRWTRNVAAIFQYFRKRAMKIDDHALAAEIAATAGRLLVAIRATSVLRKKALGAAGDAVSNALITRMLQEARPDDGFLSEEAAADPVRLTRQRVWVIDPLDGTREYSEVADGRVDWAVHVALVVDGVPAAAAVALPALDLTVSTETPPRLAPAPPGKLRILISRSRPPEIARKVADRLDAELVLMGSAGAKTLAVLRGEAHAYLHSGGQFEWDSAAPAGVAAAAGLHVSRVDGSKLRYNQPDPYLPDLLVSRPEHARDLLEAIRAATA